MPTIGFHFYFLKYIKYMQRGTHAQHICKHIHIEKRWNVLHGNIYFYFLKCGGF